MDDKWFIYFAPLTNQLYMHRSWTGFCIYIVKFEQTVTGWKVACAWANRNPKQYEERDSEHDAAVVQWVIDYVLLGKDSDYPSH